MFQTTIKGWKRLAASLVLLPGLTAVGAEMLHLLGTSRAQERPGYVAEPNKAEAAKRLMERARVAFDKRDYATAKELAETVLSLNLPRSYGEDSPEVLLAEIQRQGANRPSEPATIKPTKEDPRILVKRAREALNNKRYDAAQDLARQAEANSRNMSWSLFEDTPSSIFKDLQKFRGKSDKADANRLLAQARALYSKRASNEEERAINLEQARAACQKAAQAHGPYNMWDFGDTPQSLLKDIDAARARISPEVQRKVAQGGTALRPLGSVSDPVYNPYVRPVDPRDLQAALNGNKKPPVDPNLGKPENVGNNTAFNPNTKPVPKDPISSYTPRPMPKEREPLVGPVIGTPMPDPIQETRIDPNLRPIGAPPVDEFPSGTIVSKNVANPALPQWENKDEPQVVKKDSPPSIITKPMDDIVPMFPEPLPKEDITQKNMVDPPSLPAIDPKKVKAVELLQRALALQKGGKFVEARQALMEANRQNAEFGLEEDSPEVALQLLMAAAHSHINKLCRDAQDSMMKKTEADVAIADKQLFEAEAIATGLGLDRWNIGEHRAFLRVISGQLMAAKITPMPMKPPAEIPEAVVLPPKDPIVAKPILPVEKPMDSVATKLILPMEPYEQKVKPPVEPMEPMVGKATISDQPPVQLVSPPMDPPIVKPAVNQGYELLKQAHVEFRANELATARQIANQVLNGPFEYKDEALELLRTIDAEELTLKKKSALVSYERGVDAFHNRNHELALGIFRLIDPTLLPAGKKAQLFQMVADARNLVEKPNELLPAKGDKPNEVVATKNEKTNNNIQVAKGDKSNDIAQTPGPKKTPVQQPPMLEEKTGADSLLKQQETLMELQFQKLRSEGLQLEASATARFGKGETDLAMQDLNGFINRVKSSNIDPAKVTMLVRPIENRIDRLKVLKHQQDFLTKEAKGLKDFRNGMTQEALHKSHKQQEVARLMKDFSRLTQEGKYQEAGKVALQARELDPEDPVTQSAMTLSRTMYRSKNWKDSRESNEETTYSVIDDAMKLGTTPSLADPVKYDKDAFNRYKNRTDTSGGISMMRAKTTEDRQIESKLNSQTTSFKFNNTPLEEVIAYLRISTGLNFDLDTKALNVDRIESNTPITATYDNLILKSALELMLSKANLRYVVTKGVVKITTPKGARGEQVQRIMPVADLVIPVQNYVPSAVSSLDNALANTVAMGRPQLPGGATTPFTPTLGLNQNTGTATGTPSLTNPPRTGGTLTNTPSGTGVTKNWSTGTIEESLIRLITNSVQPDSWEAMGGTGRIEYYPLGMALVINQTPDVVEEVIRLLEALRALQDLEIAIEVRMITLAETFYERIGLDFSMNIKTNTRGAEPQLTTGIFSPAPYVNDNNIKGKILGLQAPGIPTPDLDIPIRATSFGPSIPPFGNFPNALGADGGLSLGLAFLSDIQVQMFLEAAQGDRRTNVMQAPKLTMFNGQSATISINDQQFFLTGITVTSVNGQLVFTPQNQPFPLGVQMFMQPVVSGDRRFVRLNIQQQMTNLASATVPLFPITTIVTPVFEGGSQGQPIPFTQYIQQPTFASINVQTTVVVPDGGTVLLGGLKTLSEGRNEFGPPVLSKIPYINRLFRNVGYGREAQSLMMMVTPRIIINREEQERQTGVGPDTQDPNN
ncbi:MAG: hypothetical protein K8T89_21055 [Planctomycetes bacterium]|nr:hypothetical protein [Planctomycetota bacterium]